MKFFKIALVLCLFPLFLGASAHKFYVSTTIIEYSEEDQSLQVITKIFIDDLVQVLEERNGVAVHLDSAKETEADVKLMSEYILSKIDIKVNGVSGKLNYLGSEYDIDIVKSFIEIEKISEVTSIEIENKVLIDLFDDQQNIIHIKTPSNRRTLMLDADTPNGMLKFN